MRRSFDYSESSLEPQYGAYQLLNELYKLKSSVILDPLMTYINNELIQ